jgi:WD40 repeat protein
MLAKLVRGNRLFPTTQAVALCVVAALGATAHAQQERQLWGGNEVMSSVAFSANGKKVAAVGKDKWLRVYDPQTQQQLLFSQNNHNDIITTVAFSPDGKQLATGSSDKAVKIWDADTKVNPGNPNQQAKELFTLKGEKGHTDVVMCVAYSADSKWLATASLDKTIKIWDAQKGGNPILDIPNADAKGVVAIAFSPDGKWIASGGLDKSVRLWDANNGKQIWKLEKADGHLEPVYGLAFSHDGKTIASASQDATVKLIDVEKEKTLRELKNAHKDCCNAVVFSPDDKTVYTCGDGVIKVWDAEKGEVKNTIKPNPPQNGLAPGELWSLSITSDGKWLAAGGQDGMLRIWDIPK